MEALESLMTSGYETCETTRSGYSYTKGQACIRRDRRAKGYTLSEHLWDLGYTPCKLWYDRWAEAPLYHSDRLSVWYQLHEVHIFEVLVEVLLGDSRERGFSGELSTGKAKSQLYREEQEQE